MSRCVTHYLPFVTQQPGIGKNRRWFAVFVASSFAAMGVGHLVVGLVTAFHDDDEQTVTGAVLLVLALLPALLVRWRRWPHVATGNEMRPATARRVVSLLTAASAVLAVIAVVELVVDHRDIVAVQVIAFGALALGGGLVLTRSSRGRST